MTQEQTDIEWMRRALELARRGQGRVEPNPLVGCVLVKNQQLIGEGWHDFYGGPHAEANALANAMANVNSLASVNAVADSNASAQTQELGTVPQGATVYVTLEPCSHTGKTPPCAHALIAAGVGRVVIAHPDPNPLVGGQGIQKLKAAGITVEVGLLQAEAKRLLSPYLKRMTERLPWIIAKWAMTWDGKIATATGESKWISNEISRSVVHEIRGRVDGIMVGINTVLNDDPLLTARPAGARVATRIVLDTTARTPIQSQLCRTAREFPTLIVVSADAAVSSIEALRQTGCEVMVVSPQRKNEIDQSARMVAQSTREVNQSELERDQSELERRLLVLLRALADRGMTNILVEGGGHLLGSLFDHKQIDELHVFIGGKLLGGRDSLSPLAGLGSMKILESQSIALESVERLGNDVYLIGRALPETRT